MNCTEAEKLFSARMENELEGETEKALEGHLDECPSCRSLYELMADITAELPLLPDVKAPAGLNKRIIEKTAGTRKKGVLHHLRKAVMNPRIEVAAVLIVSFFLYFFASMFHTTAASEFLYGVKSFAGEKVLYARDMYREGKNIAGSVSPAHIPFYDETKEKLVTLKEKIISEDKDDDTMQGTPGN